MQKTAYDVRISDWGSDVCSSDLRPARRSADGHHACAVHPGDGDLLRAHRSRAVAAARRARHPVDAAERGDRKSVVSGKSVSVRVDLGGRRSIKKTNSHYISSVSSTLL